MASQAIYLNSTDPPALAGYQNVKPQTDDGIPVSSVSFGVPSTGGVAIKTASYTAMASDCGLLLVFDATAPVTLTLPSVIPFEQWSVSVANIGAAPLTVFAGALALDATSNAPLLGQFQGLTIATDGANYFTERGSRVVASGLVITPSSATPVFDGAFGDVFQLTLSETVTSSTTRNLAAGHAYSFRIVQPAAAYAFQWPANMANPQPVARVPGMVSYQQTLCLADGSTMTTAPIIYTAP